jgi:hypothetical protein
MNWRLGKKFIWLDFNKILNSQKTKLALDMAGIMKTKSMNRLITATLFVLSVGLIAWVLM